MCIARCAVSVHHPGQRRPPSGNRLGCNPHSLPTAALRTLAPHLQCGTTRCATYKANTCACTSCPPGRRLNGGACAVSEETQALLHLPVEPPQQDSALFVWDALYQLEVNCSGGSGHSCLGCIGQGRRECGAMMAQGAHSTPKPGASRTMPCASCRQQSATRHPKLTASRPCPSAGTCYLSAGPCQADSPEGCGLSIQRDQSLLAKSMAASSSALRFRIRPCEGASPTDPLLGSHVQIVSALRETARLGLNPKAVKAVAQLGTEPRCRLWALGLLEGLNPDAHQWVLEPAGLDSAVRIRAPVGRWGGVGQGRVGGDGQVELAAMCPACAACPSQGTGCA